MSLAATKYEHIVLKDDVPFIDETTTKVVELVLEQHAHGWSPEELHFQHPHLSLGKIYSALAYYWDHKDDLDRDIERRLQEVEQIGKGLDVSPLLARLKSKG
jgi:uncharacterized protein (DUF433 family)